MTINDREQKFTRSLLAKIKSCFAYFRQQGRLPDKIVHDERSTASMNEREQKLLIALVLMVSQYLTEYDDEVDSPSQSAGEHALEVLADFGLMETLNARFGRWTEEGQRFRREVARISDREAPSNANAVQLRGVN